MSKVRDFRSLEDGILLLQEEAKSQPISIGEIIRLLSGKGKALIVILLCLPFCQPIQIPGFSVPFGLAIAFVGLRISFSKHVWLPKKLLNKEISPHTLNCMTSITLKAVRKIKKWVHPRLSWFCHSPFMEVMNGIMIFLLGLLLALPLPIPLSNIIAAWSLFLISLGILEDDGLLVLIGYVVAIITGVAFVGVIAFLKYIF